eukprot:7147659-Lingulodinium_polyedra.AAC.1
MALLACKYKQRAICKNSTRRMQDADSSAPPATAATELREARPRGCAPQAKATRDVLPRCGANASQARATSD